MKKQSYGAFQRLKFTCKYPLIKDIQFKGKNLAVVFLYKWATLLSKSGYVDSSIPKSHPHTTA